MGGHSWGKTDARESLKTLDHAYHIGIKHFDTAGFYAKGESERLLGKSFSHKRSQVFISSKAGLVWRGNRVFHDARPSSLETSLKDSLSRLKSSYIDLFSLHWPDPSVPLNESIDALKHFASLGLIRYWGVGNLTLQQLKKHIYYDKNIPHQVSFNPLDISQKKILEAGKVGNRCINCIVSPLAQGLLSSNFNNMRLENLGKKDNRRRNQLFSSINATENAKKLYQLCSEINFSVVSATLLWILSNKDTDVIVVGPRTVNQLVETADHANLLAKTGGGNVQKRALEVLQEAAGSRLISLLNSMSVIV